MSDARAVPDGDRVELSVPADAAYVSTLRICAASLGARCDLTVDDIEDLRLAVDEACALLLTCDSGDDTLRAGFTLRGRELCVETWVHTPDGADAGSIDRHGFAWTVLGALVTDVEVRHEDGRLAISLCKRRETTAP